MELIEGHKPIDPPKGVPVWDIDPYDEAILANPVPYYAELRTKGPFAYIPKYSILACGRHLETKEVFSDWQRFVSSRGVGLQDFALEEPWRPASIVLEVDPPRHTQTRKVIMRALSPGAVRELKEFFQIEANKLIDVLLAKNEFDAVTDLAESYPTTVFPKAVGLKNVDAKILVNYGAMVFNALGPDNKLRRDAMAMGKTIVPWIMEQCKRENLYDNGFGASIYASADAGDITPEEAGMLVRSLLSAGVDTTVTAIGNALWCFANFPEQFEILKAKPELARAAFEEVMRFTSPVHSFCRIAGADTSVNGINIVEGTKILCVLGSANLDTDQWSDADKFDITRRATGHLALGSGIHGCVGQNVARAEGEAILSAIANKVSAIKQLGEAVWRPNNAIHALDRMTISFE